MSLSSSTEKQRGIFWILWFLICTVGFLGIYILMLDQMGQIKRNIIKTAYKFTKPAIPKIMNGAILDSLKKGGHTIFIRHSARDKIVNLMAFDQLSLVDKIVIPPSSFKGGCLNSQGKTEAWLIGEIFRSLNIPVGKIYVSPTCRTIETAELAFGRVDLIDENLFVHNFKVGSKKSRANAKNRALEIIKAIPSAGKNKIIVAHGKMLDQLGWNNSNIEESGFFILKHNPGQQLEVITEANMGSIIFAMRMQDKGQS
jgi:phosphohistidine phosphatase SixA